MIAVRKVSGNRGVAHAAVLLYVLFLFSWWSSFTADKYIITKNNTLMHSGEGFWIKKSHFKLQTSKKKSQGGREIIQETFSVGMNSVN